MWATHVTKHFVVSGERSTGILVVGLPISIDIHIPDSNLTNVNYDKHSLTFINASTITFYIPFIYAGK